MGTSHTRHRDALPRLPALNAVLDCITAPDHPYNNPNLTGTEFLLNVMHDPCAPVASRIDAAAKLLKILPPEMYATVPVFREPEPWPGEQ
jgi:hypothetical protein